MYCLDKKTQESCSYNSSRSHSPIFRLAILIKMKISASERLVYKEYTTLSKFRSAPLFLHLSCYTVSLVNA